MATIKGATLLPCAQCGKDFLKTGTYHKYCRPCSELRADARKSEYYERSKVDPERRKLNAQRRKVANRALRDLLPDAGKLRTEKRPISDPFISPELEWLCRIVVPFTAAASKNHIYGISGWHVFKRENVRKFQAAVESAARRSMRAMDVNPVQNKVWMAIHVEKPNNRFDAINVIDSIADGLKKAIGIDDRWFCIRQLDWSICKDEPRFIIEFGQETAEHAQACSYCGQVQPLSEYGQSKAMPLGKHRICKSCVSLARELRRQKKVSPAASPFSKEAA